MNDLAFIGFLMAAIWVCGIFFCRVWLSPRLDRNRERERGIEAAAYAAGYLDGRNHPEIYDINDN